MRRSKILCTLGPATNDLDTLLRLVEAGMDAVRLNFSHGTIEDHRQTLALVRQVAATTGRPLPVLQDLQGPKIRVGELGDAGLPLEAGATITVRLGTKTAPEGEIPIAFSDLEDDLREGDSLLFDDGLMRLVVLGLEGSSARCRVIDGGQLHSRKGVNLPGVQLSTPALTDKDRRDVTAGLAMGVDLIALSFVRRPEDIEELREIVRAAGKTTPIVAKIEKPEAVDALDAIIEASDGVMVARGDLGVELPPQRVPLIQRHIVRDANAAGKLVIIATQMLDSMVRNPRPTRAEVTDVATAVMQGADATMLSNETAVGAHPVAAVRMMADIVDEVETGLRTFEAPAEPALIPGISASASAVGRAAVQAARDLDVASLAVLTGSGRTAALVSDYRPRQPVVAFTPHPEVYRRMGLLWGVTPLLVDSAPSSPEQAAELVRRELDRLGFAGPGERIILTMGQPITEGQQTNLLWVLE